MDPAVESFYKVVNDPKGKFDHARFQKIIAEGFAFLTQNPTHARAVTVVNDLASFARMMATKPLVPMRAVYVSLLRYEVLNQRGKEGLTPEARMVIAAVDAALADFETRETGAREGMSTLRDKIDKLAAMPGSTRFLIVAERSYADILARGGKGEAAEAHLKKLTEHPEKELADLAREDLNALEIRKEPFAAKFAALDGKDFDFATLRGKVVAAVYFRASDQSAVRLFEQLKSFQAQHRKRGFEVVAVSYDPEADREKVAKWVKDKKVTWPVYFDGKAAEGDFGPKLGVRRAPSAVLFDQKGMVFATNVPPDRLESTVRQMLGVKEPVAEAPMEMDTGGGGSRRRR